MYPKDNLSKLTKIRKLSPEATSAFHAWYKAALTEGAIPKKYKELIGLAVALTNRYPSCLELHR